MNKSQNQEICHLLKDVFLKICQKVVPFTEQLELHGLLLLEADGQEFCTVSFKDIKVSADECVPGPRLRSLSLTGSESSTEADQRRRFSYSPQSNKTKSKSTTHEYDTANHTIVNWAVQSAMDVWQDGNDVHVSGDDDSSFYAEKLSQIQRSTKLKKRHWEHVNFKPSKNKNNKYECQFCHRQFSFGTNLTRHQRSHHGRPQLRKPNSELSKTHETHSDSADKADEVTKETDSDAMKANLENSRASFQQLESSFGRDKSNTVQNSSTEVNMLTSSCHSMQPTEPSDTFLPSSEYPNQGAMTIDLGNSYIPPSFPADDMYFSIPDAISSPDSTPRIFQPISANLTEMRGFHHQPDDCDLTPNTFQPTSSTPCALEMSNIIQNNNKEDADDLESPQGKDAESTNTNVYKTRDGKEYVNIKDTEKPAIKHTCPVCQRTFDFYQNLGRHVKVSHGVSIFDMELQPSDAIEVPSGDEKKRFKCDICRHSFSFRSNLCRHKSKYHGMASKVDAAEKSKVNEAKEKSSTVCRDGEKGQKDSVASSTPRHKCDICGALFTFTSSLSRHMRRKHELVPASLYKPSHSKPTNQSPDGRKSTNQRAAVDGSSSANPVGGNLNRTSPMEFAVPLAGFHPYSVSSIIQSDAGNHSYPADSKDQRGEMATEVGLDLVEPEPRMPQKLSEPASATHTPEERVLDGEPCQPEGRSHGNDKTPGKRHHEAGNKTKKDKRHRSKVKDQRTDRNQNKPSSNIPAENSSKSSPANQSESPGRLPSERYKHFCNICKKKFTFRTNLTRHTRNIHGTAPDFPKELSAS